MIKVIGLNIKVLKKEPFSGSHQGMRFFMRAEDDTLHVWVYPEPWCFEKTSDDMKTAKDFPFTQEGLDDSMEWISQEFENRKDYWMQMEKDKMKMILQGRGESDGDIRDTYREIKDLMKKESKQFDSDIYSLSIVNVIDPNEEHKYLKYIFAKVKQI